MKHPFRIHLHPTLAPDLRTRRECITSGVVEFVSWERFRDDLRKNGRLREGEEVDGIALTDDGINVYVRKI